MEFVDVVNEKDVIVGRVSKKYAHKKGLLHRTVIAEVINSKGEWLLVKQASDRQDAGRYVSPVGGHVLSGENVEEALKREAFEELGLTAFRYKYVGKIIFNRSVRGRKENHYFVVFEIFSNKEPVLNQESISFKRFTTQELKKELIRHRKMFGAAFFPIIENFYPNLLSKT